MDQKTPDSALEEDGSGKIIDKAVNSHCNDALHGGVAEWLKAAVLKTVVG